MAEEMIAGLALLAGMRASFPLKHPRRFDEAGCWGNGGKFPNSRAHLQALDNRGRYTK